jgi:lipopolysaccharide export system permease protein
MRRLAADSELLAMRACGIGLAPLLIPTLAIGAVVSAATGFLMIRSEHEARRDLRALLTTVAARGNVLQPGIFRTLGNRVVFVRERDGQNNLRGIMIYAKSGEDRPYVIFAEQGRFDFDPELALARIKLEHGDLHVEPNPADPEPYQHLTFEKLDYEIDIRGLVASGADATRPRQMTLAELRAVQERARDGDPLWDLDDKNPTHYEIEIHRRFALPLAPLLFAMVAVALGSSRAQRSRSWVVLAGLLAAFSYYALISFGGLMAERGWIAPALAPWGPTALFAILATTLLHRIRVEATR